MGNRKQIGNLLVEAGVISPKTLERTLAIQKRSGKRLGELLREMGIVTEEEVAEAIASQFNLKTVRNFAGYSFPKDLLDLVPARMASEKVIFPLKAHEGTLAIATVDPTDHGTISQLAQKTGMRIYPVLSTREDILSAVAEHYKIGEEEVGRGWKILLIDDSPVFVNIMGTALSNEGYEVLVAGDGVEGLKMALIHHPDLILCDLFLPRMDGYNFRLAMKEHSEVAGIPVILVTSKASMEEEDKALKAGFADFIGKPIMPARVIEKIRGVLSADESEPQSSSANPPAFATKAACRAFLNRRDGANRVDNKKIA